MFYYLTFCKDSKLNQYQQLKTESQKAADEIISKYAFFAFSNAQFNEGFAKVKPLMAEGEKLVKLPGGGYIIRSQADNLVNAWSAGDKLVEDAIAADTTGEGFICDMFRYKLSNHEYGYTGDLTDTLDALGYAMEEINNNPALLRGLQKAKAEYLAGFEG